MKRPEKKEYKIGDDPRYEGYNQACDEHTPYIEHLENKIDELTINKSNNE